MYSKLEFIFHANSVQATKIAIRIRTKVLVIADIINTQINLGVFIEMSGGHDISNGEVLRFINEVTHGALIAIIEVIIEIRHKVKAHLIHPAYIYQCSLFS